MKILYTSVVNIGTEKGSSVHFLNLAHALQSRGQEVVVVALGRPAHGSANGLKVHSVPKIKTPKATTLLSDLLLGLTIVRLTISTRFDVLYHRDVPLANRWARTLGIPSIVEVNGIYVDELRAAGMNELGLRLYRYREMQVVRGARRIICVTAGIRDQLVSHYGVHHDQCVVVPNATDTELFRPQPKLECQQQVGLKPEDYNIGFVGAFKPWIDFERLLTATKCLHDQNIPARFTLVGDGLKYEEVKQQIKQCGLTESIQLIGRVPHKMIPRWIGAFDVCVAPSAGTYVRRIGKSSMKLFEYMACARPVVATALPSIIETIETAQAGLLYDIGDTNMLTQHLLSLYHDVSLREAMGVRGREYVVKHHSWDRVAERIEAVMLELLAK